jgi:hypothetical protein
MPDGPGAEFLQQFLSACFISSVVIGGDACGGSGSLWGVNS